MGRGKSFLEDGIDLAHDAGRPPLLTQTPQPQQRLEPLTQGLRLWKALLRRQDIPGGKIKEGIRAAALRLQRAPGENILMEKLLAAHSAIDHQDGVTGEPPQLFVQKRGGTRVHSLQG